MTQLLGPAVLREEMRLGCGKVGGEFGNLLGQTLAFGLAGADFQRCKCRQDDLPVSYCIYTQ
jgi:hypothetical protein